ncbi:hypothetical protein [uncultured phage MedDCM-OCT-S05-C243]|uniref:DNA polymerase n=1 Tax=uncultured phage MedDCM-OCT-S05-C243 TaxID=743558 RepID=D6PI14_9CAUD|nr:DNA polymerase I [uncultured phage MedDCM-OCT-S05-C243]ADD95365.1 hypothetical protein [uncultured phage MedDCM-OCT-S05-C243]
MDSYESFECQTESDHYDWETNYRRDYIDGDKYSLLASMCEMFNDKKELGMISEGVNAWNKLVTGEGRIHHHCSVSTNTFRCAHRKPNLAQVPASEEFRELFTASPGMVMVGADLSGIELRMLAHYLGRYDGGRYADILLNDDIHQVNADKIGITRRQVKTVTYAFLYGAGNEKLGTSYDNSLQPKEAKKRDPRSEKLSYLQSKDCLTYLERLQLSLLMGSCWHVTEEGCWSIAHTKD